MLGLHPISILVFVATVLATHAEDSTTNPTPTPTALPTPMRGSYGSVGFEVSVLQNTSYGVSSVSCGDVNGDGLVDIVVAISNTGTVGWYQNNGNEKFGELQTLKSDRSMGFSDVIVADVNGDGALDVVAAATYRSRLFLWLNSNGDGSTWQQIVVDKSATGISSVAAADLNGDGHVDLVSFPFYWHSHMLHDVFLLS